LELIRDFMGLFLRERHGVRPKENFNLVARLGMEQSEAQTPEGNLTPIARQKLQHWFSDIPMDGALRPSDLSRYFTIQTFTVIVRDLLETRGDAAPAAPQV
jgi:hypothetical protein